MIQVLDIDQIAQIAFREADRLSSGVITSGYKLPRGPMSTNDHAMETFARLLMVESELTLEQRAAVLASVVDRVIAMFHRARIFSGDDTKLDEANNMYMAKGLVESYQKRAQALSEALQFVVDPT